MSQIRIPLAAAFVAIALFSVAWIFVNGFEGEQPLYATVLPERQLLPPFSLTDQDNRPFSRDNLRGQTSLVFFGFTHCPDICPATLQQLAAARRQIARASSSPAGDGKAALPRIILVSVDPARDSPEILERYVGYFGDGITGLTGSLDEIRDLTAALGIFFEKSGSGENYTVNHSTAVLMVDPDARLQALFSTPHSIAAFVHDVPLLMASK